MGLLSMLSIVNIIIFYVVLSRDMRAVIGIIVSIMTFIFLGDFL